MAKSDLDIKETIAALEATGQYRVLRKIKLEPTNQTPSITSKVAIFLDVETTGLNPEADEIIEIGMIKFYYDAEDKIIQLGEQLQSLQQPANPLDPQISALTGITEEMVKGAEIDIDQLDQFLEKTNLIIAHNAAFDRPFCEKLSKRFTSVPWACSMTQIPWKEEGIGGASLSHLINYFGMFHDAHRAIDDCVAGVALLQAELPKSKRAAFQLLVSRARVAGAQIWAINAGYGSRGALKERGYKWNGGNNGHPKAWYREVDLAIASREVEEIFALTGEMPIIREVNAYNRFSNRAD